MGHSSVNGNFTSTGYRRIRPKPPPKQDSTMQNFSVPSLSSEHSARPAIQTGENAFTLGRQPGNGGVWESSILLSQRDVGQDLQKTLYDEYVPDSSDDGLYYGTDDTHNAPQVEGWLPITNTGGYHFPSPSHPSSSIPVPSSTPLANMAEERYLPPPESRYPNPLRFGNEYRHLPRVHEPHPVPLAPLSRDHRHYARVDGPTRNDILPPLRSVVPGLLENENGGRHWNRKGQYQGNTPWQYNHHHHQYHHKHPNHGNGQHGSHYLHHGHVMQFQSQIQGHHYHGRNYRPCNLYENGYEASHVQWRNEDLRATEGYKMAGVPSNPHHHLMRDQNTGMVPNSPVDLLVPSSTPLSLYHPPFPSTQANNAPQNKFRELERERERQERNEKERRRREKIEIEGPQVEFRRVEWEKSKIRVRRKEVRKGNVKGRRESIKSEDGTDGTDGSHNEGKVSPKTMELKR